MRGGFRSLHPFTCFFFYVGALVLCMLMTHPYYSLTAIGLLILLIILNGERAAVGNLLKYSLPLGILFTLINPLFSHRGRHILFYVWEQPITLESVVFGILSMLTLLTVLLIFVSYHSVISSDKFLFLFGSLFPKSALMAVMSIRFFPLLKQRLTDITAVQRTKGINVLKGTMTQRMSAGMKLLQILLTMSLEEALQMADSMKAKGYGTGHRSRYIEYRMRREDGFIVALLSLLLAGCLTGRMFGYGLYRVFPSMDALVFQGSEMAAYFCFVLFLLMPILLEGREMLIWRSWKLRN